MLGDTQDHIRTCLNDRQYRVAVLIAPLLWLGLYSFDTTHASLDWVVVSPWLFLSLVLVQPVLEECVFRGALQGWLIKKAWAKHSFVNITCANLLTSIVFVGMHFFYHVPLMALSVLIPSMIFGYFRDRYEGWLLASIGLHCFYNLGYFFLYAPITS